MTRAKPSTPGLKATKRRPISRLQSQSNTVSTALVPPVPGQPSMTLGPSLIAASVGLALILWGLSLPLTQRYASSAASLKSLANVAAFAGTVLYSWSVMLSARWRWTEQFFGGLDKVYKWHHITGGLAFLLLALHPLFLTIRTLIGNNPAKATSLWILSSNWQINWGIISLYALVIVLPLTVFLRMRYQLFIWVHRILGFVFFAGFLHAFMAHGNIARYAPLYWYMLIVMGAAMVAFISHSIIAPFAKRGHRYSVAAVNKWSDSVIEIRLDPVGRFLKYVPGQFAYIRFLGHPVSDEAHPFSMASGPLEKQLRFVVKVLGDYTASILALQPGTTAIIDGPHGGFSYKYGRHRHQVWIAGGIGVTPFLAMARALPKRGYDVDFYYCVINEAEAHFRSEFEEVAELNPGFRLHVFCQDQQGFLNSDFLVKDSGVENKDIFICGPPPMMHALHDGLIKAGVRDKYIHFEDFTFK